MPEKPEVVTVARKLEARILNRKILKCHVYCDAIVDGDTKKFIQEIENQTIHAITTRGKWIVIELEKDDLLVHLRMTGKFFYRKEKEPLEKHQHIVFLLDNQEELRFHDVRKFGRMKLIPKELIEKVPPFTELGLEPWDQNLTVDYLKEKFQKKSLPIKTTLLDQSIMTGIGNIYDDEILFASKINPLKKTNQLSRKEMKAIIENTRKILEKAIQEGGTTIRDYTSEEGVTGLFQNSLSVHTRVGKPCPNCKTIIQKITIAGRSTYYCPNCQKE